jgi:hypothetical protein
MAADAGAAAGGVHHLPRKPGAHWHPSRLPRPLKWQRRFLLGQRAPLYPKKADYPSELMKRAADGISWLQHQIFLCYKGLRLQMCRTGTASAAVPNRFGSIDNRHDRGRIPLLPATEEIFHAPDPSGATPAAGVLQEQEARPRMESAVWQGVWHVTANRAMRLTRAAN